MAHLKNYRGATNYFTPSTDKYRVNYDRIFGSKDKPAAEPEAPPACTHVWHCTTRDGVAESALDKAGVCNKCGEVPEAVCAHPKWIAHPHIPARIVCTQCHAEQAGD